MVTSPIFFSYSRKDSAFVLDLARKLRDAGADVWLDQLDIEAGTNWDDSVEEALERSEVMLVILSTTSVASQNVRDEYSYAIEENKKIIPVLIEPCTIPFRLRRLQYADFTSDENTGMATLTETLGLDAQDRNNHTKTFEDKIPKEPPEIRLERVEPMEKARMLKWGLGLVVLVVFLWLTAKYILAKDDAPAQVTVYAHAESGMDKLVLPGRGVVKLLVGDAILEETINSKGEATFKQIPDQFFDDGTTVGILFYDPEGEPYRSVNPDSSYVLSKGEYISLPVILEGLDQVYGIVKDFNSGNPIEGVRISIKGSETFTDQYGEYRLDIPEESQQQFQTVRAFKEGYELFEQQNIPIQTRQELSILLKPDEQ